MAALKAGVVKINITPPPGTYLSGYRLREKPAWTIQDELWAVALTMEKNGVRNTLLTIDLLNLPLKRVERMRSEIQKLTGIPAESVMMSCTHTHSAPYTVEGLHKSMTEKNESLQLANASYLEVLEQKLIGAVVEADRRLEPVSVGVGAGELTGCTINRRNPAGPIDPVVSVMRVRPESKRWLAVLVNFACHPTSMGPRPDDPVVTPDYPGHMARFIESKEAPDTYVMFANGAAGNIDPWNFYFMGDDLQQGDIRHVYTHSYSLEDSTKLGRLLALEAMKSYTEAAPLNVDRIGFALEPLTLPVRPWPSEHQACRELERCRTVLERIRKGDKVPRSEKTRDDILYERQVACFYPGLPVEEWGPVLGEKYSEEMLKFVRERDQDPEKQIIRTQIQVLFYGDLAMVGIPGELFVEIGQQIKERSPFSNTLVFSYSNDFVWYLPTPEALPEGGYGATWSSRVTDEARDLVLKAADAALIKCRDGSY